jgi:hypothetical protein
MEPALACVGAGRKRNKPVSHGHAAAVTTSAAQLDMHTHHVSTEGPLLLPTDNAGGHGVAAAACVCGLLSYLCAAGGSGGTRQEAARMACNI